MKEDLLVFYRWLLTPLSQPLYASYNTYAVFMLFDFSHLHKYISCKEIFCLLFEQIRSNN